MQPIIGCELGLRREGDGRAIRVGPAPPPDSVVLLAQNEQGYRNLLKLVSKSFLETAGGEPPQLDIAALEGLTDGLLLLTGGPAGPVGRLLRRRARGRPPRRRCCGSPRCFPAGSMSS